MIMHKHMYMVICMNIFAAVSGTCIISALNCSAHAQQSIKDSSGSTFMEEVAEPGDQNRAQQIKGDDGSLFMEEVPDPKRKRRAKPVLGEIDYSGLGVPVDAKGRIIPLIQPGAGPVMRNYSRLEMGYTPPTVYIPYSTYYGPFSGPFPFSSNSGIQPQLNGIFTVPLGYPRYYMSSSDDPASQNIDFGVRADSFNAGASMWSPGWRSPFGGSLYGQRTQFQNKTSIHSFFPENMNQ